MLNSVKTASECMEQYLVTTPSHDLNDKSLKEWNSDMSDARLMEVMLINFNTVHGYNLNYAPKGYTREWILDQLHALVWYASYDREIAKAKTEETPTKKVTKPRKTSTVKRPRTSTKTTKPRARKDDNAYNPFK